MQKKFKRQNKNIYDLDRKERAAKIAYNMAKSRFIDKAFAPKVYELDDLESWQPAESELSKNDFKNDSNTVDINYRRP
jgi:hypothetical protein